jgi:hypothetical protein
VSDFASWPTLFSSAATCLKLLKLLALTSAEVTLDYTILELFFGARIQPVNHAFTIVATRGNASETTLQPGAPLGI